MPLYEYECEQCHRHTERRQKFSDPEITVCPHCGGHLKRVISAPAIAFKGGGWYADGYGNAKPKTSGESKPAGEGRSETSGSETSARPASGESAGASTPAASPAPAAPAPSSTPATAPTKS